jgi:uroporphyrinogen III methyltransferase/synthase
VTVYLVGAGPGDPGLLTLRAAELLARADVVVHDRLVDSAILALIRSDAVCIDVGKSAGEEGISQREINELLVERGKSGGEVVRLKGGDPFVFGRGGEEAQVLEAAGIHYEVVPGISSFAAAPAAAGVPLTMRGLSSSFLVVTGHDPAALVARTPISALVAAETLVVMMGAEARGELASRLIDGGKDRDTPVLIVESGTTPEQRTHRSTLAELAALPVGTPATLVIGAVAGLRLASYEDRPLFGWRVVVTRAAQQAGEFLTALSALGAIPISVPTIAIAPPVDGGVELRQTLGQIQRFDWVVLASINAVQRLFGELADARALAGVKVAVIGEATAASLRTFGVVPDLTPYRFSAEGLLEAFPVAPPAGGKVMIPRADIARDLIAAELSGRGWDVVAPIAYRTVYARPTPEMMSAVAAADVVTFASSSAVHGFIEGVGREALPPVVASIGPSTSATLRELGVAVDIEPAVHTVDGVVAALCDYAVNHARTR